jgi:hypothetical protein
MAYGALQSLLSANRPMQSSLTDAIAAYLPMGGGQGPGEFPAPPPAGGFPAPTPVSGYDFFAPENAMPVAAALLKGPTFGDSLGGAFAQLGGSMQRDHAKRVLAQQYPDLASFVDAGVDPSDLMKLAAAKKLKDTTFGTPTLMTKPDGTQTYVMFGNDGSMKEMTGQGGLKPGKVTYRDAGTYTSVLNSAGNEIGQIPKDMYGAGYDRAAGTAAGKSQGEAQALYQSMTAKMPGVEQVVKKLDSLANDATYTLGGQALDASRRQLGLPPRDAAKARAEYIATVSNQILPLLRDTFGAQFTAREGDTLMATLGDPDKSPQEKQAVLKAFIEQKRRDIEALARQTGQSAPAVPSPDATTPDPGTGTSPRLRYNPATGELE